MLRDDRIAELRREYARSNVRNDELKEFYALFDKTFLGLFPSFIDEMNGLLADEARRVIASSPAGAWTPGEQRGEKVRVKYTLPVDFYLQGSGDKLSERPEKPQGSLDGILVVGYGATSK